MIHERYTTIFSIISLSGGLTSLIHDLLLIFNTEQTLLGVITNFLFILLLFLSILTIGLYHYWKVEKHLYYLPRYFLSMFFIGLIGSLLIINITPSKMISTALTIISIIFAIGLSTLAIYTLQRMKRETTFISKKEQQSH